MADEVLSHIARSPLPWRSEADNDTECGHPVTEFAKVITWDDAVALVKKHGQARAAFLLCVTCVQTTRRHGFQAPTGQCTFDGAPTERMSREFGKRREQTDRELRAMAELISRHRDEFDDLMSGRVVTFADVRSGRAKRGGEANG